MSAVRLVVVGGSSGIGYAIAQRAATLGASVVVSARRADRLAELSGCVPIVADVRSADDCERLGVQAAHELGEIDLLVYAAGISPLRMLADFGDDEWQTVLGTNLLGAHRVLRSLLPFLAEHAVATFISSDSVAAPRPGLVPYAASKSALESLVRGFRTEHPTTRFTCWSIGPTFPTGFADSFDLTVVGAVMDHWSRLGMAADGPAMTTESVAEIALTSLHLLLSNPTVSMDHVLLQPAAAGKATH
jgi:NAD(P)-dependent dehydrogenase (short-subunit alcohol dehydrogenase family)